MARIRVIDRVVLPILLLAFCAAIVFVGTVHTHSRADSQECRICALRRVLDSVDIVQGTPEPLILSETYAAKEQAVLPPSVRPHRQPIQRGPPSA